MYFSSYIKCAIFLLVISIGCIFPSSGNAVEKSNSTKKTDTIKDRNAHAASEGRHFVTSPTTKRGRKWRIGYIESGSKQAYRKSLIATVRSFIRLGWAPNLPLPLFKEDARTEVIWSWLATEVKSDYIEFVKDAYWNVTTDTPQADRTETESLSSQEKQELNKDARRNAVTDTLQTDRIRTELLSFQKKQELDLVICMGTEAGILIREMSEAQKEPYKIPTIVAATTDAVLSDIVDNVEDSGYNHLLAQVDPDQFKTQVQIFHSALRFQKLGVIYNPELVSHISSLKQMKEVAKERRFSLVECHIKYTLPDELALSEQELVSCYEELASQIDAMYVTITPGFTLRNIPNLIALLDRHYIPSFVQAGVSLRGKQASFLSEQPNAKSVEMGMLMTVTTAGYGYLGDFYAETVAKIFNGAQPREITQTLPSRFTFIINLETAKKLRAKLAIEILGAADELYGIPEGDF